MTGAPVTATAALGVTRPLPHLARNSGDWEWYSPPHVVAAARRVLGGIDLDPATSPEANGVVRAARYYTAADDGLVRPWRGRVWMNPPYAARLVRRFTAKLIQHHRAGDVPAAIVFVNNATDTRWFQALVAAASALCLPQGRLGCWHPRKRQGSPLQGRAILYLGPDARRFVREFRRLGTCTLLEAARQVCAECGVPLVLARADAAYCSPACRQRAYRRRKASA